MKTVNTMGSEQHYSVLMSVYNREKAEYLRESIESMLAQTLPPSDFVIVCDGPLTEELDGVIAQYAQSDSVNSDFSDAVREKPATDFDCATSVSSSAHRDAAGCAQNIFRIVRLPENVGLGRALNAGLKCCRYDCVARMDSDDISLPDRCEKELSVLLENKLDLVSGALVEFSDEQGEGTGDRQKNKEKPEKRQKSVGAEKPGNLLENAGGRINGTENGKIRRLPEMQEEILRFARRRNPFNHPCVMYRKSSVEKAGGYVHCEGFEDYHLWVRMLQAGMRGYNLPDILLRMRTSGMYDRRGGLHYAKNIISFRFFMWRTGFCSFGDFLYAAAGHVAVSVLPAGLRRIFYDKLLRR